MQERLSIQFQSGHHLLAGVLERPSEKTPIAYALFAHCFTCGKDSIAAARIAKELVSLGYAVFRFDFAGIGHSSGDFSETNYSTKVQDMLSAGRYLAEHYVAPSVFIGHSLGGRVAISAGLQFDACQTVVTIGSPAYPSHVLKQFLPYVDEIEEKGKALVQLAGRPFEIRKHFIEDAIQADHSTDIESLGKPLLIFHSPKDETVKVQQAAYIYKKAQHPKSFISLDGANHLLTGKADAIFVSKMIDAWLTRYLKPIAVVKSEIALT